MYAINEIAAVNAVSAKVPPTRGPFPQRDPSASEACQKHGTNL
jgi:hypothetical protein